MKYRLTLDLTPEEFALAAATVEGFAQSAVSVFQALLEMERVQASEARKDARKAARKARKAARKAEARATAESAPWCAFCPSPGSEHVYGCVDWKPCPLCTSPQGQHRADCANWLGIYGS
jgi:hypothetical protein